MTVKTKKLKPSIGIVRKNILPLLLLISHFSFSQQNNGKVTWAFPITDYIVGLNDSTKVVQIQLPDHFTIEEKQLGLIKGVYMDSYADTARKDLGGVILLKVNIIIFPLAITKVDCH